jgi:hypothetical protein
VSAVDRFGKTLESQANSQLVEQIEPEVRALVVLGRRRWDPVKINVDLLASVPLVQDRLAQLDPLTRSDPDAEVKAISDALEAAIQTLPSLYKNAALDHFGFTDEEPQPMYQEPREDRAAKAWGYAAGWYRRPRKEYFGMQTRQYVIALVTCAFCGIANPIAYIAEREGADADVVIDEPQARGMFEAETFFRPIEYAKVPFDLEQIQRALFASNYRKPITLLFPKEGVNGDETATDIEVTVELAHALYMLYEGDEQPPAECYDAPDWYLRGIAHFTGPTGEQEAAPAHVYLQMNEDGSMEFPVL